MLIIFLIHYISVASRLLSVTTWPWLSDPHYQFSSPSYGSVCGFKALCCKYILCRSVGCINEITLFSVNMFTPYTLFLPTPVRQSLWCWPSVCFDFSHFEQIIFYFSRESVNQLQVSKGREYEIYMFCLFPSAVCCDQRELSWEDLSSVWTANLPSWISIW